MPEPLTPREKQAALIVSAGGHTNRDVAKRMGICEGTVKQYLYSAYQKLGVEDRRQLIVKRNPDSGSPDSEK